MTFKSRPNSLKFPVNMNSFLKMVNRVNRVNRINQTPKLVLEKKRKTSEESGVSNEILDPRELKIQRLSEKSIKLQDELNSVNKLLTALKDKKQLIKPFHFPEEPEEFPLMSLTIINGKEIRGIEIEEIGTLKDLKNKIKHLYSVEYDSINLLLNDKLITNTEDNECLFQFNIRKGTVVNVVFD